MKDTRFLIVNADDFGLSHGVNQGIVVAHEQGIVTSASLMVRPPAAPAAIDLARQHPELSLGLHVDLSEWEFRDGAWVAVYQVVDLDNQSAVAAEVARQLDAFRRLVGRDPSHLDSHQHLHRKQPLRSVLLELARKFDIPLRHLSPSIVFRSDFYGQTRTGVTLPGAISVERVIEVLKTLTPGISELVCHPGIGGDLISKYNVERAEEVKTLCDPSLREVLAAEGIVLRSFSGLSF
jgi:predicted glycoside hydrolase/deacetylase ChbG (UPF0249 family)